jgi:hypothetical protein
MILDYIDHLEFDAESENYLFDAQETLGRLSQGLYWLFEEVNIIEQEVRKKANEKDVLIDLVHGILDETPIAWLSCAFQWYSVSVYNYCRLVGYLASSEKNFAAQYPQRVIPNVITYRHKIAAHLAITKPYSDDNLSDIRASVNTKIIFARGRLRAGAISEIFTGEDGKAIKPNHRTSWSLVNTHNRLIPRYWPNGPLEVSEAIRIPAKSSRKFTIDWND